MALAHSIAWVKENSIYKFVYLLKIKYPVLVINLKTFLSRLGIFGVVDGIWPEKIQSIALEGMFQCQALS